MASKGELTNWTIAFQHSVRANPGTETRTVGDWNMTSNFRSGKRTEFDIFTMSNSSLVSINHEKFDFPKDARATLKTRDEIKRVPDQKQEGCSSFILLPLRRRTRKEFWDVCQHWELAFRKQKTLKKSPLWLALVTMFQTFVTMTLVNGAPRC